MMYSTAPCCFASRMPPGLLFAASCVALLNPCTATMRPLLRYARLSSHWRKTSVFENCVCFSLSAALLPRNLCDCSRTAPEQYGWKGLTSGSVRKKPVVFLPLLTAPSDHSAL